MKKIDRSKFWGTFKAEAEEHLRRLNKGILNLAKDPANKPLVQELLRVVHTLKGAAKMVGFANIGEVAHGIEDVLSALQKEETAADNVIESLLKGVDAIESLTKTQVRGQRSEINVEELLYSLRQISRSSYKQDKNKTETPRSKPLGKILLENKLITKEELANALKKQKEQSLIELEETIRVTTSKLDNVANAVGEMVINHAKYEGHLDNLSTLLDLVRKQDKMINMLYEKLKADGYINQKALADESSLIADQCRTSSCGLVKRISSIFNQQQDVNNVMAMIIDRLQNYVMTLRMLPVSRVFDLFPRTVYDLAKEYKKSVTLDITGAETEIDKKMLEQIKDSLMHLLRNAVDHGIESPDERKNIGKSKTGRISLAAWQEGDRIFIKVADDGRGIDLSNNKEVAVKQGLITSEEAMGLSDTETRNLIFRSGFTTSPIITDVSGRGVGMDVVQRHIEDVLCGQIKLSSEVNKGTEIILDLPLTLTVTPSILIELHDQIYAIPATAVQISLRINPSDIQSVDGKPVIRVMNSTVLLIKLDQVLGLSNTGDPTLSKTLQNPDDGGKLHVVVIEYARQRIAFLVDRLIKEQDVIVKPLEEPMEKVKNIAGVTILEKGEVAPILHIPDLIDSIKRFVGDKKMAARDMYVQEKSPKQILIVEDSLTTRELEKNILKSLGYEIATAVDGVDALNKINEQKPDLIVTDIQMPRLDGFELTKKIKDDSKYKDIPVVIVTTLDSEEEKKKGIEIGADAYITKSSFDQTNLVNTIESLIG
jgi:two-component system chemotaxis sensor kinase CheA